jgi:hypothetical protein
MSFFFLRGLLKKTSATVDCGHYFTELLPVWSAEEQGVQTLTLHCCWPKRKCYQQNLLQSLQPCWLQFSSTWSSIFFTCVFRQYNFLQYIHIYQCMCLPSFIYVINDCLICDYVFRPSSEIPLCTSLTWAATLKTMCDFASNYILPWY